jgi:hypothetical protein
MSNAAVLLKLKLAGHGVGKLPSVGHIGRSGISQAEEESSSTIHMFALLRVTEALDTFCGLFRSMAESYA